MYDPVISPDGRTIAFSSTVDGYDQVFVMLASGGQPLQLTKDEGNKYPRAFSADGNQIFFSGSIGDYTIWAVPTLGGTASAIAAGRAVANSSDGQHLYLFVYPDKIVRSSPTGGQQELLAEFNRSLRPRQLIVSPGDSELYVITEEGAISRLDLASRKFTDLKSVPDLVGLAAWAEPGKSFYLARSVQGITNLWQYTLPDGALKQITFGPGPDISPLVDPAGKGVYFVNGRSTGTMAVYRIATHQSSDILSELGTQPWISHKVDRVVYITQPDSHRYELWIANLDGSSSKRLFSSQYTLETLAFTGDDKQFLFDEAAPPDSRLYSIDPDGSHLRELPKLAGEVDFGATLRGTNTVVFTSYPAADSQTSLTWKLDLDDPKAQPVLLFKGCTGALDVSADGNYVIGPLLWGTGAGLYQYSIKDQQCTVLKPGLATYFALYAKDQKAFYYVETVQGRANLYRQSWSNGQLGKDVKPVLTFPFSIREDFAGNAWALSDDLSTLVYVRPTAHDDLYLMSKQ